MPLMGSSINPSEEWIIELVCRLLEQFKTEIQAEK